VLLGDGGTAHQRIVELLIDADADLDLADKDGVTPLQHAEQRGQRAIAAKLRAAGAR
jgi:ankyrin repeat protein